VGAASDVELLLELLELQARLEGGQVGPAPGWDLPGAEGARRCSVHGPAPRAPAELLPPPAPLHGRRRAGLRQLPRRPGTCRPPLTAGVPCHAQAASAGVEAAPGRAAAEALSPGAVQAAMGQAINLINSGAPPGPAPA
jgi:hypothetical protein